MIRRTLMRTSLRGTDDERGCCVHRVTCETARMDEIVAILNEDNRVTGSAPRSVMRRDNLRHSATGVLVRNPAGDIYVHRRTPTKDVYPGRYDFSAGGVVAAGEDPYDAVVRELAEE